MQVIIFVGLQGSGKSTFYQARFANTHRIISKDLMKNRKNKEARQQRWLREALQAGQSVVIDNTNPTRQSRAPLIAIAREYGAQATCYYFSPSVKESLERNAQREGRARVPDEAIHITSARLAEPTYNEGFDMVYVVRALGKNEFSVIPVSSCLATG